MKLDDLGLSPARVGVGETWDREGGVGGEACSIYSASNLSKGGGGGGAASFLPLLLLLPVTSFPNV